MYTPNPELWSALMPALVLLVMTPLLIAIHIRLTRQSQQQIGANIEQLKLLRQLLADFQRHRGLSAGLLAGDDSLRQDQRQVSDSLSQNVSNAQRLKTTHERAWRQLIAQWQRLKNDTSRDAQSNLLKHNALIRNTIFLIEDVAGELDISGSAAEARYLNAIWREVVHTAEWAGQARALGTGIAAARQSSAAQRVRLRFLHQKIELLSSTAFATLSSSGNAGSSSRGMNLLRCQQAVGTFMHCIEQEFLVREQPQIEAKSYFEQATLAINELLALVDVALNDLQQSHRGRG